MDVETTPFTATSLRTHHLGELRIGHVGKLVSLCGWVHRRRDHGGLIFIDLRDRYGLTQIVFDPEINEEAHKLAAQLRSEWNIGITGKVRPRAEGMANPKLETGEIEIEVTKLTIFSQAKTPPFSICDETIDVNEDLRLKYRYLEIRRGKLMHHLALRHQIVKTIRDFFDKRRFYEIETPILTKSTPEGARDYLVPSRVHEGNFYALPQSPQLFKQLLMISGIDRYFQIARCFRDEDLRADRQPEFTQLDVEMSFVNMHDIQAIIEEMMIELFDQCLKTRISRNFRRMTHDECLSKYGTDRPDLRFEMTFHTLNDIAEQCEFSVFREQVTNGGSIKAMRVDGGAQFSRRKIDELGTFVTKLGLGGLAWMKMGGEGLTSNIVKFFSSSLQQEIIHRLNVQKGDLILFGAGQLNTLNLAFDQLRRHLADLLHLRKENAWELLWVTDFPLFEKDPDTGLPTSVHHPFTCPHEDDLAYLDGDVYQVRSNAYDLVLNGSEIGGGSMRIHNSEIQKKIFEILRLTPDEIEEKFGFFVRALQYGTPPHGGIAFGIDRIAMTFAGASSIREMIAFPKTQRATDAMMECPTSITQKQLDELHIQLRGI